jgi:Bacterial SH3 domain
MNVKKFRWLFVIIMVVALFSTLYTIDPPQKVQAQQPTGSIPTVTGTPLGPTATIKLGMDQNINVRSYPSSLDSLADQIGVILPGQVVNVKGKTIAGDWLLIEYPGVPNGEGWVWSSYMDVKGGSLPIVEMPPTPAPRVTSTIDPTLAAQFVITPNSTSLPTFTQPAPLTVPTYSTGASSSGKIPIGLVIIVLIGLGAVVGLLSVFQSR